MKEVELPLYRLSIHLSFLSVDLILLYKYQRIQKMLLRNTIFYTFVTTINPWSRRVRLPENLFERRNSSHWNKVVKYLRRTVSGMDHNKTIYLVPDTISLEILNRDINVWVCDIYQEFYQSIDQINIISPTLLFEKHDSILALRNPYYNSHTSIQIQIQMYRYQRF